MLDPGRAGGLRGLNRRPGPRSTVTGMKNRPIPTGPRTASVRSRLVMLALACALPALSTATLAWLDAPPALVVPALLLVLLGGLAAAALGRSIAQSIEGLVGPALALARGEASAWPSPRLHELAAVSSALGAAARLLDERTQQRDRARSAHEALLFAARHDALTALPNRRWLMQQLHDRLQACRAQGRCLTLFFIDLDNFKAINDRCGHATGDALLQAFATRLRSAVREGDLAGRLGGDEFVVVVDGLAPSAAEGVAQTLLERLSHTYALGTRRVAVTASLGLAGYPADGADAGALLAAADRAMYAVKTAGKGHFRRSDPIPL